MKPKPNFDYYMNLFGIEKDSPEYKKIKKRWENALRIGGRINRTIKQGYIIVKNENDFITNGDRVELYTHEDDEFFDGNYLELVLNYGDGTRETLFILNPEWNKGWHTPINEFNKKFKSWKKAKLKDLGFHFEK